MGTYKEDVSNKLKQDLQKELNNSPVFVYDFIDYINMQNRSLRSHIAYVKDINNFLKYYSTILNKEVKHITIDDLNKLTLRDIATEYYNYLESHTIEVIDKGKKKLITKTNKKDTIARKISTLKKLLKYLYKNELIESNVLEDYSAEKEKAFKLKERLDGIEIADMKHAIVNGKKNMSKREMSAHNRLKLRNKTIFYVLAFTGIRVSELVSLDIEDIDMKRNTITVIRKNDKIQEIPMQQQLSEVLEEYLSYRRGLENVSVKKALFVSQKGTRISDQTVRMLLKEYSKEANLEKVTCHTLRRSFLSALYNSTKDIKLVAEIGGHSVATASKYYVGIDEERYRNTIRTFNYDK